MRLPRCAIADEAGFGLSGLVYDVLVRPTAMLWPSTLVILTLLDTLHHGKEALQDGRASLTAQRLRFFSIALRRSGSTRVAPPLSR